MVLTERTILLSKNVKIYVFFDIINLLSMQQLTCQDLSDYLFIDWLIYLLIFINSNAYKPSSKPYFK